jgi:hypothetical protein
VAAADHGAELEDGVHHAIILAEHAAKDPVEGRGVGREADEQQAMLGEPTKGHRAAEQEGRRREVLLGGAAHMGLRRRVLELDVVLGAAADQRVAGGGRVSGEAVQRVRPGLHRREGGTGERPLADDGGVDGVFAGRVLGAVDIAREVAPLAVPVEAALGDEVEAGAQRGEGRPRPQQRRARVLAVREQPELGLVGRAWGRPALATAVVHALQCGDRLGAGNLVDQRPTQAEQDVGGQAGGGEGGGGGGGGPRCGAQPEREGGRRRGGEGEGRTERHGDLRPRA